MKNSILFCIVIIFALLISCEKFELNENSDTFFHVKIEGTELPVWVKGIQPQKK